MDEMKEWTTLVLAVLPLLLLTALSSPVSSMIRELLGAISASRFRREVRSAMVEMKNWTTLVLAVLPLLLTALSSPASPMIRTVIGGIVAFAFSWRRRRNSQIKIKLEGEEKGVSLMDELCGEVLVEILSRVPARDLVQLKSVCRRWNATISSPFLVSTHLRNYTNGPAGYASQTLMVCECPYDWTTVKLFSPYGDDDGGRFQSMESEMPIVSGPCNGLFLMARSRTEEDCVRLWNPATGKCADIAVPPPPRVRKGSTERVYHYYDNYGFGLDPVANDFKIVMIRHFDPEYLDPRPAYVGRSSPELPAQVLVYTPGTGIWTELEELRHKIYILYSVESYRYLNGFFFWECASPLAALAFDLGNDVFRVINDPVPVPGGKFCAATNKQLLVYKDTLALFIRRESTTGGYDLWLLNEEWCWLKHFTVDPFYPSAVTPTMTEVAATDEEEDDYDWSMQRPDPYMFAVGCWRDDELILYRVSPRSSTHEFVLFDPATRAIKVAAAGVDSATRVSVYRDSLVG